MSDPTDLLYSTPDMMSLWSAESHVARMLEFEAALARSEARAGIIPETAARAIEEACRILNVDVPSLYQEASIAGTLAIPLVRVLTSHVQEEARGFVHWGASSQDAIDTALVLQMREGLRLLEARLLATGHACGRLALTHRNTLMVGRTLLQDALPITFGLKAARWLSLVTRQVRRLRTLHEGLAVQLGGAAGTLASLAQTGPRVTELLAEDLQLAQADLPWHTERDRIAEVAAALGVLAGSMAKIAGDILLMTQSDVGEVAEATAPGKGGSSAMPQKRNPVDAMLAVAAARIAIGTVPVLLGTMAQEHERAAGGWQAEWQALPDVFRFTAGAVERVHSALSGLEVHIARMAANVRRSGGQLLAEALSMALAPTLGRPEAHALVRELSEHAVATGVDIAQIAQTDERVRAILTPEALERVFDPAAYLGSTQTYIDRAVASFGALLAEQGDKRMTGTYREQSGVAVTADGARIVYEIDGPPDAPALIFSNSLGTDLHMWDPQVGPLTQHFRVIRYDARGHGRSDAPAGPYSLEQLASDLLTILDTVQVQQANICGLSLGGQVTLWLLAHRPDRIYRAVCANTAAKIGVESMWNERIERVRTGGMSAIRDAGVARFLSESFRHEHPQTAQWLGDMLLATPPNGYIAACQAVRDADLRGDVTRITSPVLIIGSTLDESTPASQAHDLHQSIPGSRLVVLDRAAHLSNIEQPEAFTSHLLAFLLERDTTGK